jgi:hypothetical protein
MPPAGQRLSRKVCAGALSNFSWDAPNRAESSIGLLALNMSCPSTRTRRSRPAFLKLPGAEATVGREAKIDAGMVDQILRSMAAPSPAVRIFR